MRTTHPALDLGLWWRVKSPQRGENVSVGQLYDAYGKPIRDNIS